MKHLNVITESTFKLCALCPQSDFYSIQPSLYVEKLKAGESHFSVYSHFRNPQRIVEHHGER